jgi:penicillin-binding protein 1A
MALSLTCPHCGEKTRLGEPYPLPGSERQCACGRPLVISYPVGMMQLLRERGAKFDEESESQGAVARVAVGRPPPPVRADPTPLAPRRVATSPTELAMPAASATGRSASAFPMPSASVPALLPPLGAGEQEEPGEEKTQVGTPLPPPRPRPTRPIVVPSSRAAPPSPPRLPPKSPGKKPAPPRRGRLRRWMGAGFAGSVAMAVLAALLGVGAFFGVCWYYGQDLPDVDTLARYRPPTVTVVYDQHGELMGEIYEKRRYVVELEALPKPLTEAFIAAEDAAFYEHGGVDYMGIVRAIGRNALAGKKAQGASTITQQVAKNFLLTSEKSYSRKIKEVLLAWRIEEAFDKNHILYLYLNQIYLGSGAYGVEAASRVYFGKHVGELDLAESAMIAGLPQRPSDYSPHRHFEKAKGRQKYVLTQMAAKGFITAEEADAAYAQELTIVRRKNEFLLKAPWFTEHVRRDLVARYGQDKVYNEGLVVTSTCDLALQQEAQKAITGGVADAAESIGGWRGAAENVDGEARAAKVAALAERLGDVVEGEWYSAVVTDVQKKHAIVDLGGQEAVIPLSWTTWAWPVPDDPTKKGRRIDDLSTALRVGDIVTVEIEASDFRKTETLAKYDGAGEGPFAAASLFQEPDVQGALWSYRLEDGAVLAMVGGVNFQNTEFNRATQAERQVGSTFKPIVYAAAIESRKFTTGTIVQDAPLVFNTLGSQLWKPANYGEDYLGDITLRRALALSRNVVTVRVLDVIGLDPVYQLARKLGIESHMDVDLSMGLGSSSLTMPEIARAYSAFATVGHRVEPHYIERVVDRDGTVLEQFVAPAEWEQVLDPSVAQVMNWLLIEVATSGTAAKAQKLGVRVAGKTGTTNENRDAWFVGYTPTVLTAVWVGYDTPKTLGGRATGGHTALPIWMQYMGPASPKAADRPWPTGGNLVYATIDESTGRLSAGGRSMPFLPGTVPGGVMAAEGQKTTEDLLTTEW